MCSSNWKISIWNASKCNFIFSTNRIDANRFLCVAHDTDRQCIQIRFRCELWSHSFSINIRLKRISAKSAWAMERDHESIEQKLFFYCRLSRGLLRKESVREAKYTFVILFGKFDGRTACDWSSTRITHSVNRPTSIVVWMA